MAPPFIMNMIQKIILFVLLLLACMGGCLPLVELVVSMLLSYFICDISPEVTYTWYSGIWHGLFFLPNWMWSGINGALYKAEDYTYAYNVLWWIFSVGSTLFVLLLYNIPKVLLMLLSLIFGKR